MLSFCRHVVSGHILVGRGKIMLDVSFLKLSACLLQPRGLALGYMQLTCFPNFITLNGFLPQGRS